MKKAICVLLLAFCLQVTAFADYTYKSFNYTEENGSVTITGCFGDDETVVVPAVIAGNPVNSIAAGAFDGNTSMKTLYLPDTVMVIEDGALPVGVRLQFYVNEDSSVEFVPPEDEFSIEEDELDLDDDTLDGEQPPATETQQPVETPTTLEEAMASPEPTPTAEPTLEPAAEPAPEVTSEPIAETAESAGFPIGAVVVVALVLAAAVLLILRKKKK